MEYIKTLKKEQIYQKRSSQKIKRLFMEYPRESRIATIDEVQNFQDKLHVSTCSSGIKWSTTI
jgi:hypothetical protein